MAYVPIQFPTWSYDASTGNAVVVQTAVQLAALPPTYAAMPTFVPKPPSVTAVTHPLIVARRAVALTKKDRGE